jgi:putative methyltransferase (TIGR04325 family)
MFREFIRDITPPFMFMGLRGLKRSLNIGKPIYDKFYARRADMPAISENPFAHPNWMSYVAERAAKRKAGVAYQDMHEMSLSLLASLPTSSPDKIIVDFGGGVGMYWPAVKGYKRQPAAIKFIVVDNEENCICGRKIFGDQGVIYESDFQCVINEHPQIYLINVSSTLHYCIDYETVIAMLCRSSAQFVIISRHPAPDDGAPVAYAIQNVESVYGFCGQIQVVLLSVEMITQLMARHGYVLVADYYDETGADKYWQYTKAEVPHGYRLILEHCLVFRSQLISRT